MKLLLQSALFRGLNLLAIQSILVPEVQCFRLALDSFRDDMFSAASSDTLPFAPSNPCSSQSLPSWRLCFSFAALLSRLFPAQLLFAIPDENGYQQEIKQIGTNSNDKANPEKMFQLREETKLRWWTRTPFGCPERSFCGICWWKQKQIYSSHLLFDPTRVSKLASSGWRRIRVWSRHGPHHSLWRSSFPVSNVHAQIIRLVLYG